MKTPTPFRFDGHGINDAEGRRIAKVSLAPYDDNAHERNTEFDELSNLFAASADMLVGLKLAASGFATIRTNSMDAAVQDAAWENFQACRKLIKLAEKGK